MTTPTPDESGAAGAERPEPESNGVAPGAAAATTGATDGPVTDAEAAGTARPTAGTPDRLVKRGPAAPKPTQGSESGAADDAAAAAPRPPAAAPEEAPGAGAPAGTPATTPQAASADDDAAPAAPAPQPPGAAAPAVNGGGLDLTRTPNSAPAAASLPPAPSAPPAAASLPATPPAPPAPPAPVATVPATATAPTAPPAGPHNPWAAPSPAAAHPNPWAAPAPAAVPAAFGAPPQPGEQLPREPLSIAAIGAAGMLLSPVALGLSALALRRHRRRPARGRSLAVAAATIAVAQLGVAAVAVPVALSWDSGEETAVAAERTTEVEPADDTPDDGKAPSKDDPEWQDWHDEVDPDLPTATGPLWADVLAPGDCIGALPEGDAVLDLGLVSCEAPHEGEVFGRVELFGQGEEAPDDEELMDLAYQGCDPQIVPYLLDSWKVLAEDEPLEVAVMHPTAETWAHGDRQVTCYFVGPGGEPTTGSARGNPAAYDVDQRTLLRITGPRDSAMLSSPYLHDHERLTAWAETTGEAAENQAALLRNIYLDQYGATPAALGLARAREAEAEFWREVADAPDTDAFYAAMAEDETIEAAETAEAKLREKLDLPTS